MRKILAILLLALSFSFVFVSCSSEEDTSSTVSETSEDNAETLNIDELLGNITEATTVEKTTAAPTTVQPATAAPTTVEPTTVEPTSQAETKAAVPNTTVEKKTEPVSVKDPVTDSGDKNITYVLNTNTHKFHHPSCSSVDEIKSKNRQDFTGSREEVINQGYEPCKRCNP